MTLLMLAVLILATLIRWASAGAFFTACRLLVLKYPKSTGTSRAQQPDPSVGTPPAR